MTDAELEAIEQGLERAKDSDLRFTAPWVFTDVPALVAEVRKLRDELVQQRLGMVRWHGQAEEDVQRARAGEKLLKDLARRCKAEVILEANPHSTNYETVREYLERGNMAEDTHPGTVEACEAGATLWALQFYPLTPISFYVLHDSDLERLLRKGHELLDTEGIAAGKDGT